MLDGILTNLQSNGPWGLAVAVLLLGLGALWRRLCKERDDYFEQTVKQTAVLVELNVLLRNGKQ